MSSMAPSSITPIEVRQRCSGSIDRAGQQFPLLLSTAFIAKKSGCAERTRTNAALTHVRDHRGERNHGED